MISKPTPKEVGEKRISGNKLTRIPKNGGRYGNKENDDPVFITKNKLIEKHFKDHSNHGNPFAIPNCLRLFTSRIKPGSIKPEPIIMSEPHTIRDIDPTFFQIVDGRPVNVFIDNKVYMKTIRDITLCRANTAYLKEQILAIQSKITCENYEYEKVRQLFMESKTNFVHFVIDSYKTAKKMQAEAIEKSLELASMTDHFEELHCKIGVLSNKLSYIAINFEKLVLYATFLNSLAPDSWKEVFDVTNTSRNKFITYEELIGTEASVSSLDVHKINIARHKSKPYLFLMEPFELMEIYEEIRLQCLNYIHIEVVTNIVGKDIIKACNVFKLKLAAEIAEMEEFLQIYEENIIFGEKSAIAYEKAFKRLLVTEFQDLYSSLDNAKLFTCVQYVSNKVLGIAEDPRDSVRTLMLHIENLYFELMLKFDKLNQGVVKAATNKVFTEDIKNMDRAYKAQRAIKQCDTLSKALHESFEPPRPRRYLSTRYKNKDKAKK